MKFVVRENKDFGMGYCIRKDGGGEVPMDLRGYFTDRCFALEAIEKYNNKLKEKALKLEKEIAIEKEIAKENELKEKEIKAVKKKAPVKKKAATKKEK